MRAYPRVLMTREEVTDPSDPRLGRGVDESPVPQHDVYLVLSEEERAQGFVRPVRRAYVHVGIPGPRYSLRGLTPDELDRWGHAGYVQFESFPDNEHGTGRFWTQEQLDSIGKGCGTVTTMSVPLAETYARNPRFYGATYCCGCNMHRPVGEQGEFIWDGTDQRVGT